jgi:secondary thiamine-phosphate synthase enzyme
MRTATRYLTFELPRRRGLVRITGEVAAFREDDGDAHLKNLLVGHQVIVPVTGGRLDLGPWQQIFYWEFDGRRPKRVVLKAMGA